MKVNRTTVVLAVIFILVLAGLSMPMIYVTLSRSGDSGPNIEKLDIALPSGYTISSAISFEGKIVLCCCNDSNYMSISNDPAFSLLTYAPGDKSFLQHPINIYPYETRRTSLNVINGSLYLSYTMARGGSYTSYSTWMKEVNVDNWTLGQEVLVYIPSVLAPGAFASDGKSLYILGGSDSNKTAPYWPLIPNDNIYQVNLTSGKTHVVATVPDVSSMHGVFLGEKLVLLSRSGGFNGPEVNFGASVNWNSTEIYDLENGTMASPSDMLSFVTPGSVPASDDLAIHFFNPLNTTSPQWNYTNEIWKMTIDGSLSKVALTLPAEIHFAVPVRCGDWFFLINLNSMHDTTFWRYSP
jgi:hypothetical protein